MTFEDTLIASGCTGKWHLILKTGTLQVAKAKTGALQVAKATIKLLSFVIAKDDQSTHTRDPKVVTPLLGV